MRIDTTQQFMRTYETVAANSSAQVMGPTGAIGDIIEKLVIIPAAVAVGAISIIDNATTITVLAAGTLADLKPIILDLGMKSAGSGWKVTTGANASAIAIGRFS